MQTDVKSRQRTVMGKTASCWEGEGGLDHAKGDGPATRPSRGGGVHRIEGEMCTLQLLRWSWSVAREGSLALDKGPDAR